MTEQTVRQTCQKSVASCVFMLAATFFNAEYFSSRYPHLAKGKSRPIVLRLHQKPKILGRSFLIIIDQIDNFVLTASRGGRDDDMIDRDNLRESVVVFSEDEAYNRGLEIDHDDSHAAVPEWRNNSFALLVHGVQPKGSKAAEALKILKRDKVKHSYNRKVTA